MSNYAYYRLPYSDCYTKIESDKSPVVLNSIQEIGNKSGFAVVPFSEGDIVLLLPDRITKGVLPDVKPIDWNANVDSNPNDLYQSVFEKFHSEVVVGIFSKIVLARKKEVEIDSGLDLFSVFCNACRLFPRLMIILFQSEITGTWLIASPEILLESRYGNHHTVALAGTMPYQEGYGEWNQKNKHEQHIVENYINDTLSEICTDVLLDGPISMRAGYLQHLRTDFRFKGSSIGEILSKLHPTPAVSGLPKDRAVEFIVKNECLDRKYYSGFSGPVNIDGETHLFVSLRCAEIDLENKKASLYAGGGIMPESDCILEWLETEQKMSTISCIVTKKI